MLRTMTTVLAVVVVLCVPLVAAAQLDPYAEPLPGLQDDEPKQSKWIIEAKAGLYFPQVDSGVEGSPFAFVFGGESTWMPMIEVNRILAWPMGQLGVTVSAGYTYKTASGFEVDNAGDLRTDSITMDPLRYDGYRTVFRLYPISVGGVYRFTWLDDRFGAPFVPYAKLGLSAYIWRFLRPEGTVDLVDEDPLCSGDRCLKDRRKGTSLGFQWTLGLAIRVSQIDQFAGNNLAKEWGIDHSSFFFEVTGARVDGNIGSKAALDVGELTWFAGLNFEF